MLKIEGVPLRSLTKAILPSTPGKAPLALPEQIVTARTANMVVANAVRNMVRPTLSPLANFI